MPRPGPRPYECVRRAWHSDRHQPIRGSLIQEIFRIANEIHSPTTKKNKEWQEKLPIVVLKAEEIMYSKANSEAEYMDLKTLWNRANDAINTIIRRDESSEETGEFLQPCIEAALHLGCIPRRSSRSQRNNHPRDYLTGNMDLASATEPNPKATSSLPPYCSKLILGKESRNFAVPITSSSCIPNEMRFQSSQKCFPSNGSFLSKSYPVYPLYYGFCSPPIESQVKLKDPPISSKSVSQDHLETGIRPKLSLCNPDIRLNRRDPSDDPPDNNECDLSLRLGFASVREGEDAGTNRSRQDSKQRVLPKPSENNVGSGSEILDVELTIRKRKAGEPLKDERYPWHPNLIAAYSNGGTRTAGL